MTEELIKRINELARKQREIGLTDEEKEEQGRLRAEYLAAFRRNMKATLDCIEYEEDPVKH